MSDAEIYGVVGGSLTGVFLWSLFQSLALRWRLKLINFTPSFLSLYFLMVKVGFIALLFGFGFSLSFYMANIPFADLLMPGVGILTWWLAHTKFLIKFCESRSHRIETSVAQKISFEVLAISAFMAFCVILIPFSIFWFILT